MKTTSQRIRLLGLSLLLLAGCVQKQSSGVVGIPRDLYHSRHAFGSREGALEAFGHPTPRDVEKASPQAGRMLEDMTYEEKQELLDMYRNLGPEHQALGRKDPEKAIRYYNRNFATPLQPGDLPAQEEKEMLERYQNLPPEAQQDIKRRSEEHIR